MIIALGSSSVHDVNLTFEVPERANPSSRDKKLDEIDAKT